jgi:AraC family transcriptional regulator of adaptative response/methylated-DNA-[protein]-cysteine methyltransferase
MNDAMNLTMNDLRLAKPGTQNAALRDYDSVRRAIAFISERWRTQPTIEAMAEASSLTPDELHHLFRRWAGCMICSSPMRRCLPANGRPAAKA